MLLMIDNYDSFTYNLVQYLEVLNADVTVYRNDKITVDEVAELKPACIVISPGPCTPHEAGISVDVVKQISGRIPILGVCLGHQCIGAAYGGRIINAGRIMHGKVSEITHNGEGIFQGMRSPFKAIRYHSLAIEPASLPECLEVTARSEDDEIMGIRHRQHMTLGVQFHPESILTRPGKRLLGNFLKMVEEQGRGQNND